MLHSVAKTNKQTKHQKDNMHPNVYNSTIYNSQDMEAT